MNRDVQEFEAWELDYTSKCCVHPDLFSMVHKNRKDAYMAGKEAERARSRVLVEALEECSLVSHSDQCDCHHKIAQDALKTYRGGEG